MSDLSKIAEWRYLDEQRREFKFESGLSRWLKRLMAEKEITRKELAKKSGLTVVQISEYMNDYTILNHKNAVKLAIGIAKTANYDVTPVMLKSWQQEGRMVNMVERRKEWDNLLLSIGAKHDENHAKQV